MRYPSSRGYPCTDQQMKYLIRRGRYASCVYAGGLSCYFYNFNIIKIKAMRFSSVFQKKVLSKNSRGTFPQIARPLSLLFCSNTVIPDTCIPFVILPVSSILTGSNSIFAEALKNTLISVLYKNVTNVRFVLFRKTGVFPHLNSKHYILNSHESIRRLK